MATAMAMATGHGWQWPAWLAIPRRLGQRECHPTTEYRHRGCARLGARHLSNHKPGLSYLRAVRAMHKWLVWVAFSRVQMSSGWPARPSIASHGQWPMARGHGQWPWPGAMASGHGPRPWPCSLAMAEGHGRGPWPLGTVTGYGSGPWPMAMATGHGHWPWPSAMANGHGRGPWPEGPWPGAMAIGHGPRPWPVNLAMAVVYGHWPLPLAMATGHGWQWSAWLATPRTFGHARKPPSIRLQTILPHAPENLQRVIHIASICAHGDQ